jgi:hypothetical protein
MLTEIIKVLDCSAAYHKKVKNEKTWNSQLSLIIFISFIHYI